MLSHAVLISLLAATAHAATIQVAVGASNLTYTPSSIMANVGDVVEFVFHPKNHTATQSSFGNPCSPIQNGFDSGFMPVANGATALPSYTVTVNDTAPIWVYCRQKGPPVHCFSGMVFAINPDTDPNGKTFDAFKAEALALGAGASTTTSDASIVSSSSDTATFTSPPSPVIGSATATVTLSNTVYTTTYVSWEGAAPNPTPASQPATHTVLVGESGTLTFTPNNLNASIGDTVSFAFQAKNHSATQSSFNSPCTKALGGFDSGFNPVSANATFFPSFNITVNDTKPIWVYCAQDGPPPHCEQGMVMGINTPSSGPNTFAEFLQLAMHTNETGSTNSSSSSGSGSGTSSSGAGRAAVSIGLGMGITAFAVTALL